MFNWLFTKALDNQERLELKRLREAVSYVSSRRYYHQWISEGAKSSKPEEKQICENELAIFFDDTLAVMESIIQGRKHD